MFTLLHEYRYITNLYTNSHKSLKKSIFSSDQFSVVDWTEHSNISEWVSEPNTGNKTDVSQDRQCQICHRNHIAKRRGELTHEIVHNASIIVICHSIDCDNVAVIYKACTLYWSAVLKGWAMLYSSEGMGILAKHCAAETYVGLILQYVLNYWGAIWSLVLFRTLAYSVSLLSVPQWWRRSLLRVYLCPFTLLWRIWQCSAPQRYLHELAFLYKDIFHWLFLRVLVIQPELEFQCQIWLIW